MNSLAEITCRSLPRPGADSRLNVPVLTIRTRCDGAPAVDIHTGQEVVYLIEFRRASGSG